MLLKNIFLKSMIFFYRIKMEGIMKKIILLLTMLAITACTTLKQSTRLNSEVQALEFNRITSSYLVRPTFVQIDELTNGGINLVIKISMYDGREAAVAVGKQYVADNIVMIEKFLDWEAKAIIRGDQFTKEIGTVVSWVNDNADISNKYEFHSGNVSNHYLVIASCALGQCLDKRLFFDSAQAKNLKKLLEQFQANELSHKNIDQIYN